MNHTQMRIAIAESLGWIEVDHGVGPNRYLVLGNEPMRDSSGKIYGYSIDCQPPDYINDLNAIVPVVRNHPDSWAIFAAVAGIVDASIPAATATAAQWSEAYLKTINLWKP